MSTQDPLLAFLEAQWELAQRAALAISGREDEAGRVPDHWQWVDGDNDRPVDVDLAIAGNQAYLGVHQASLRSVEEYPTASVGDLPVFVLHCCSEVSPQAARHIMLNDPAAAVRRVRAERLMMAGHKPFQMIHGAPSCTNRNCDGDEPWPCYHARIIASAYEERPGFDPAWRLNGDER